MATSHMNTTGRRERTDVHVRPVDRRRPPEREPSIRDLIQATSLSICQLFVLHGLLKPARLLPKQALPRREVSACVTATSEDVFRHHAKLKLTLSRRP